MIIGFIVEKNAYYKYFGPVIEEALKHEYKVICMHNYSQPRTGMKGYLFPSLSEVPGFMFGKPILESFNDYGELIEKIRYLKIEVIVSFQFLPEYVDLYKTLKKYGIYWTAIQYGLDTIKISEYLHVPDRYFFYSEAWIDMAVEFLIRKKEIEEQKAKSYKNELMQKIKNVGFTELDQFKMIDPKRVRDEWNIPEKPVVLYLPFDFLSASDKLLSNILRLPTGFGIKDRFWMPFIYGMDDRLLQTPIALLSLKPRYVRQVLNKWNDVSVVKALRKFCDNNDAYLLVKSRMKNPVRNYLSSVADKVMYDEGYYPADILKCLAISNICINFGSTVVLEAIPCGVPNICIQPDKTFLKDILPSCDDSVCDLGEVFDFPGASYKLDIPESIDVLSNASIDDFPLDKNKQNLYINKFLSYSDGSASHRIIKELEDCK